MARIFILILCLFSSGLCHAGAPKWYIPDVSTRSATVLVNENFREISNRIDSDFAQSLVNSDGVYGRWVGGWVSAGGALLQGYGFTAATSGTGVYTVTYSIPFSSSPFVSCTAFSVGSGTDCVASVVSISSAAFTVDTFRLQNGVAANTSFYFMSMGGK